MVTYISNTAANTTWVADTTVVTAARLNTENTNLYANDVAIDTALALSHDATGYFNPTVGSDVASANALTLGTGNIFDITGTTAITSIGTKGTGYMIWLQFDDALTLTHHATDLQLPDATNITTATGDVACLYEYASADWRLISYSRADAASGVLSVANGGTGASTLTDGGLLLGSGTGAITALAVLADSEMIVGDGTTDPVAESGATLRTSIGVGTGDSPQFTGVELSDASANTLTGSSGDALIEGVILKKVGLETIWVPASSMTPATTNGAAALTTTELTAGTPELITLAFDTTTAEFALFTVAFPKSWDEGTVTFETYWSASATDTGTGGFTLAGVSIASDVDVDTAFGTAVANTALAASGTQDDLMKNVVSGNVTIASAAVDTTTWFRIARDVATDTNTGDLRLIGVKIFFTTDASNDT
ncbi:MAG: hypothetical protein CMD96_05995 [Gammaproteobacteria bacterium]|nr:hypothetical protein [Gammaproteobacteria bacterium]|tara:strand:+ start:3105 stop:4373 length:1269 start_codon:yes stop_codon:yes gene_type:complete